LRREIADLHPKLARKDKAPRTMIFFAVAAFPIVPKTLYGAARLLPSAELNYQPISKT
jgi:hypothetical protein